MSGSAVRSHTWPNKGRQFYAKRTTSYLVLFQGYPPIVKAVRLQHRHCRICLQHVQPKSEVTDWPHESGADHPQKPKTNMKKRDGNRDSDVRLRDLPEWWEEFTNNLEDTEAHAHAHISQDSDSGRPTKVVPKLRKHSIYTYFPKRPKLRSLLANPNDKGSLQETHWRSPTSSRQVWWFHDGWSQSLQWGGGITEQSPVRCPCSRSCHSMDSILSVQKQNFSGSPEEPNEVPGADEETKCHLHWQFLGIWQVLRGIILESLHVYTTQSRNKWDCRKNRVKEGTSVVLLQPGLDEKWWAALWNAVATCETSKTFWQKGKLLMKGDSENHSKGQ